MIRILMQALFQSLTLMPGLEADLCVVKYNCMRSVTSVCVYIVYLQLVTRMN